MNKATSALKYIESTHLDDTFLIGYYGGGNFGDELLLEVLLEVSKPYKPKGLRIFYKCVAEYTTYHTRPKGVEIVNGRKASSILNALLRSKCIVIGGGGHWGQDSNRSTVILGLVLILSRFVLMKHVVLLGVGYYDSTNKYGRFAAWLTALSANQIYARDTESFSNFARLQKSKTVLDADLATLIPDIIGTNLPYTSLAQLHAKLHDITKRIVFIAHRRVAGHIETYLHTIQEFIEHDKGKHAIILLSLENKSAYPDGDKALERLSQQFAGVVHVGFNSNPLDYYRLLLKYSGTSAVIAPQYHCQLISVLTNTPLLPVIYDNKNGELIKQAGAVTGPRIDEIQCSDIEEFLRKVEHR